MINYISGFIIINILSKFFLLDLGESCNNKREVEER